MRLSKAFLLVASVYATVKAVHRRPPPAGGPVELPAQPEFPDTEPAAHELSETELNTVAGAAAPPTSD